MFFSCMVQAGQLSTEQRTTLESQLSGLAEDILGDSGAKFHWIEIERGHGFTGAKPSTSALALGIVPEGTAQDLRVKLMEGICAAWMDTTQCSLNEIVATAADESLFAQTNA